MTTMPPLMIPVSTRPTGTCQVSSYCLRIKEINPYSANATNLVHVLQGETQGLVGGTGGGLNGVNGVEEGLQVSPSVLKCEKWLSTDLALDDTSLGLLLPSLVPGHVGGLLKQVVSVLWIRQLSTHSK